MKNQAFTLIELLVVVLIIGILAAIALPQYQKAVEKANAAEALPILKSLYEAQQNYYLTNGKYADKFSQLDLYIPWTGNVKFRDSFVMRDTISNDKWSLQIYREDGYGSTLVLGRLNGKYKGSSFNISLIPDEHSSIYCTERKDNGIIFEGNPGDYCEKIFQGTFSSENWNVRAYSLPNL